MPSKTCTKEASGKKEAGGEIYASMRASSALLHAFSYTYLHGNGNPVVMFPVVASTDTSAIVLPLASMIGTL
jgi:hypothetical protein